MPKKMDFPLASLSTCLKIADSVFKLGGSCSKEKCAKKLGKTVGGGFQSLLASSVKYNLIKNAKNQLTVTDLYRQIHFSYSEEEKKSFMVKAFQNVPLYHSLLNKTFPYETLSRKDLAKRLVKEYGVEDQKANRVAGLFLKDIQCLNFNRDTEQNNDPQTQAAGYSGQWNKKEEEREASLLLCQNEKGIERERETKKNEDNDRLKPYQLSIKGPGLEMTFSLQKPSELLLLDAIFQKIKNDLHKETVS